jgi:glutamine synthetase adenylyltransferase
MPELIDLLVSLGLTSPHRTTEQVAEELAKRIAAVDASDPEAVWSAVAEVKNGNVLRVGLADFGGALDPLGVCGELTPGVAVELDREGGRAGEEARVLRRQ